jgi:hypothetical protein
VQLPVRDSSGWSGPAKRVHLDLGGLAGLSLIWTAKKEPMNGKRH